MRKLLSIIAICLFPIYASAKDIAVPDCFGAKNNRFLITVNTKDLSKDELLTILYKASGPNHPSFISPAGGVSFMGAGPEVMYVSLKAANSKTLKLPKSKVQERAKDEVKGIVTLKGIESVSCF